MAITKIINIVAHPQNAVDYICNPDKTDGQTLIYTRGCDIKNIKYTFDSLQRGVYEKRDITKMWQGNKAYHLVQSFKPNEVDADTAHKIGIEWADKVLEGKYSYVLSTHIDKGHIHNHIIFCSADNMGKGRYHSCTKERYRREHLNDEICRQYGLSIPDKSKTASLPYNQWEEKKQGFNWYIKIRSDIDTCIDLAQSFEDFKLLLQDRGYVINDSGKYITFKPEGKERAVRGKSSTLGDKYTREAIQERIDNKMFNKKKQTYKSRPKSVMEEDILKATKKPSIVDLHREDIQGSVGLTRWARRHNLNNANDLLNLARSMGYSSMQAVSLRVRNADARIEEVKKENAKLENQLVNTRTAINYMRIYLDLKKYDNGYRQANDKELFFEKYEHQLMRFDEAMQYLKAAGLSGSRDTLIQLQNSIGTIENEIANNNESLKRINDDIQDTRYIKEQWDLFESSSRMTNIENEMKHNKIKSNDIEH